MNKITDIFGRLAAPVRRRWKRIVLIGGAGLAVVEIAAIWAALSTLSGQGIPADIARDHFFLTRYTLNLVLQTPTIERIESTTKTDYRGFEGRCNNIKADALLGWRNQPGVSCGFLLPAGGAPYSDGMKWSAYDADGFMVSQPGAPKYSRDKPEGTFRIIMLGDSSLVGFGAPPMQSIAAHTQNILNALAGKTGRGPAFQVINAGVGGYNSAQQYLYLASELIYYQPDIVFFFQWLDRIHQPAWPFFGCPVRLHA